MPGFVVHQGALVTCLHMAPAQPTSPSPQVKVMGMPVATAVAPYSVAGCPQAAVPAPPCVTAVWSTFSTRVTSMGQPLVLFDSQSVCVSSGAPLRIWSTQTAVTAT